MGRDIRDAGTRRPVPGWRAAGNHAIKHAWTKIRYLKRHCFLRKRRLSMPIKMDQVKGNPKKLAALLTFMKKEHNEENFMFYFDKGNAEGVFKKYISKSAAQQVNLPANITNPLEAMASIKNWKAMDPGIKLAKESVLKMVNNDVMPRFERSPEWKAVAAL